MKTTGFIACCLLFAAGCSTQPVDPFAVESPVNGFERPTLSRRAAHKKLRKLNIVDGDAVYASGGEGEFYILSLSLLETETEDGFLMMLEDPNPIVRVMGLWCLNKTDRKKHLARIESLNQDKATVDFVPVGCVVDHVSVGEIAKQIIKNPHLLEWRHHAEQQEEDSQQSPAGDVLKAAPEE